MQTCEKPIVLFSARYLPSMGGVEFFTSNLAQKLASLGNEVLIVTTELASEHSDDAKHQVGEGSLEVLRLSAWGPARAPFVRRDQRYREVIQKLEGFGSFHALINTRLYDLSVLAAKLCNRLDIRPVLLDHGTDYIRFPSKMLSLASKVYEQASTARLRRYDIDYYGVSRGASIWLSHFGLHSCGEIHNALDAQAFVAQQSARDFRKECQVSGNVLKVVFASRLLPEKGADTIIEAAQLLSNNSGIHFFVAGSGPLQSEIQDAAKGLRNLTYVGRLTHPDLAALLLQSDVFCFPTRYGEGLPTSLLEAGACGCALVTAPAGGVDEIIPDASYGIVLHEATAKRVAQTLRDLECNRANLTQMQQASHAHICECFTWEKTAQEALVAFERASR